MKIAYIVHPIGGDVKGNIEKVLQIIREINLNEPNVVPFAPYLPDCLCMDDDNPKERARGIKNDVHILKSGMVDELRLYGDRISKGMSSEIALAATLGIPIVASTPETKKAFRPTHSIEP